MRLVEKMFLRFWRKIWLVRRVSKSKIRQVLLLLNWRMLGPCVWWKIPSFGCHSKSMPRQSSISKSCNFDVMSSSLSIFFAVDKMNFKISRPGHFGQFSKILKFTRSIWNRFHGTLNFIRRSYPSFQDLLLHYYHYYYYC